MLQKFDKQYLHIFSMDPSDCWVALVTVIKGSVCVLNGKKCYLQISHKYRQMYYQNIVYFGTLLYKQVTE